MTEPLTGAGFDGTLETIIHDEQLLAGLMKYVNDLRDELGYAQDAVGSWQNIARAARDRLDERDINKGIEMEPDLDATEQRAQLQHQAYMDDMEGREFERNRNAYTNSRNTENVDLVLDATVRSHHQAWASTALQAIQTAAICAFVWAVFRG
jgi:hypothetical protein